MIKRSSGALILPSSFAYLGMRAEFSISLSYKIPRGATGSCPAPPVGTRECGLLARGYAEYRELAF
jgi:hypothetical protein